GSARPSHRRHRNVLGPLIDSFAYARAKRVGQPGCHRLTGRTHMELTRRHALAGAAALAASPLLPAAPARAAAPLADKQAPSYYRYKVGDAQVNVISDGVNNFALPATFVLNAKKDEVNAALEKAF